MTNRIHSIIEIESTTFQSLKKSFKHIATFAGNGCYIKPHHEQPGNPVTTKINISSYSSIAINRAIVEIRLYESNILRHQLQQKYYRPTNTILIFNLDIINDDFLNRLRRYIGTGCFLYKYNVGPQHYLYIKTINEQDLQLAIHIVIQSDLRLTISNRITVPTNMVVDYPDTIHLIGMLTKTNITLNTIQQKPIQQKPIQQNNEIKLNILSNSLHSLEYTNCLISDMISQFNKSPIDLGDFHSAIETLMDPTTIKK